MKNTSKDVFELQIPEFVLSEFVHPQDWKPLDEGVRWEVAACLGLPRPSQGVEPTEIKVIYSDKTLPCYPISRPPSLWRELLPYPYAALDSYPGGPRVIVDDTWSKAVDLAQQTVSLWEHLLPNQELSALWISQEVARLIGVQTVRRKRVRLGLLSSAAKKWTQECLDAKEGMESNQSAGAGDGLPKIQIIQVTSTPKVTACRPISELQSVTLPHPSAVEQSSEAPKDALP